MCGIASAVVSQQPKTRPFLGDVPIGQTVVFEWEGAWKRDFETCAKCGFVDEDRQYITGDCPECGNGGQAVMRVQTLGEKFKEGMVTVACCLIFLGGMSILWAGVYWLIQHNSQK